MNVALSPLEICEDTEKANWYPRTTRWDKRYNGQITINEIQLAIEVHLICMEEGIKDPQGKWFLHITINNSNPKLEFQQHAHCIRCSGPGCQTDIVDDYKSIGDTKKAVTPVVVNALKEMGIILQNKYKHNYFYVYFNEKSKNIGKEKWSGYEVTNKWKCLCPVHGEFSYTVTEPGGA